MISILTCPADEGSIFVNYSKDAHHLYKSLQWSFTQQLKYFEASSASGTFSTLEKENGTEYFRHDNDTLVYDGRHIEPLKELLKPVTVRWVSLYCFAAEGRGEVAFWLYYSIVVI